MKQEPILIRCKHCNGYGERDEVWFVAHPKEYSGGYGHVEPVTCRVCKGTGKVALNDE